MRTSLLLPITIIFLVSLSACARDYPIQSHADSGKTQPPTERLIGHWLGSDHKGQTGDLVFYPDGDLVFVLGGKMLGSEWKLTYTVNTNTYPWDVVCSANNVNTGQTNIVHLLIEMINDNTIRCAIGDNPRVVPTDFKSNSCLVLIRQK